MIGSWSETWSDELFSVVRCIAYLLLLEMHRCGRHRGPTADRFPPPHPPSRGVRCAVVRRRAAPASCPTLVLRVIPLPGENAVGLNGLSVPWKIWAVEKKTRANSPGREAMIATLLQICGNDGHTSKGVATSGGPAVVF